MSPTRSLEFTFDKILAEIFWDDGMNVIVQTITKKCNIVRT